MQLKENGLKKLRVNKSKFIYLLSPEKINESFYVNLIEIFKSKKVAMFQLRLKKESRKKKILVGKKLRKICNEYNIKLIINDDPIVANIVKADGCHLGQNDQSIVKARETLGNKIIGVTCHNSISLVLKAKRNGADYIALGAFFKSDTKKVKYHAKTSLINKSKILTKIPIVVIGGINNKNFKKLLLHNPDFLAISGYIWNNKYYNPKKAITKLNI